MADMTITQQDYEALVALARRGTTGENHARDLEEFLRTIEDRNGLNRYFLAVRWQELDEPLPPGARFPGNHHGDWPTNLEGIIELTTRAIARVDVDALLAARASSPMSVMVTTDPGLRVGWTPVDDYFL